MTASILVLGPGHWARRRSGPTPLQIRRLVATIATDDQRNAFLMEDRPPKDPANVARKFLSLLDEATDVWVVWPKGAKMATTVGEMNHLRFLMEAQKSPPVTVFYQDGTAEVTRGRIRCVDDDAKNAYLQDLFEQPGVRPIPWKDLRELIDQASKVADARS